MNDDLTHNFVFAWCMMLDLGGETINVSAYFISEIYPWIWLLHLNSELDLWIWPQFLNSEFFSVYNLRIGPLNLTSVFVLCILSLYLTSEVDNLVWPLKLTSEVYFCPGRMLTRDGLSQLWNEMVKDGELQQRILPDHNLRWSSLGTNEVLRAHETWALIHFIRSDIIS